VHDRLQETRAQNETRQFEEWNEMHLPHCPKELLMWRVCVQDQEKMLQQQKTCREAEQERQWKQLQALRQQEAQQQQQTIHDQRAQVKPTH
jgi:hypothetical protein